MCLLYQAWGQKQHVGSEKGGWNLMFEKQKTRSKHEIIDPDSWLQNYSLWLIPVKNIK